MASSRATAFAVRTGEFAEAEANAGLDDKTPVKEAIVATLTATASPRQARENGAVRLQDGLIAGPNWRRLGA